MRQALKLLAPYFAVAVFWCGLSNAWLAIIAYHAQILWWSRDSLADLRRPGRLAMLLLALPTAIAAPILYYLLPHIAHTDLSVWLADHQLTPLSFAILIPYFGLIHPFLEQLHWTRLRHSTPIAHLLFAGYHMMVLYSLLTVPWLVLSFVVLTMASWMWGEMTRRCDGLAVPVGSHILADLGVILAAWLRM